MRRMKTTSLPLWQQHLHPLAAACPPPLLCEHHTTFIHCIIHFVKIIRLLLTPPTPCLHRLHHRPLTTRTLYYELEVPTHTYIISSCQIFELPVKLREECGMPGWRSALQRRAGGFMRREH